MRQNSFTLQVESNESGNMTNLRNIYLLKDLAKITGYSTHTLKFYLRMGLLEEIGRSPETNFRYFDDSNVHQLKTIRQMSDSGLSLKDIKKQLVQLNKKS